MKKNVLIALLLLSAISINAQVTLSPGFRAGANYSRFTQVSNPNERFTPKTDFYAGAFGTLQLTKRYAIQPEITYSRQGSNKEAITNGILTTDKVDINYISVANLNKFTIQKFSFLVGPSIDFLMKSYTKSLGSNGQFTTNNSIYNDAELVLVLGLEYEITSGLGIEARFKHALTSTSSSYYQPQPAKASFYDYVPAEDISNMVFQLGLTYTFKKKKTE